MLCLFRDLSCTISFFLYFNVADLFFFFTILFIYLIFVVLGLCCCVGFFLAIGSGGYSLVAMHRLLIVGASLVAQHWL